MRNAIGYFKSARTLLLLHMLSKFDFSEFDILFYTMLLFGVVLVNY
jgi:hypothetical protein